MAEERLPEDRSNGSDQSDDRPPAEVNVVVTGFSPWGEGTPWPPLPVNTSWLIANALPRVIFRANKPDIRILTYPKPLHNGWTFLRHFVPKIWDGDRDLFGLEKGSGQTEHKFKVHAILHMGMLDQPNSSFRLERNGFKKGYTLPDIDGKHPSEDDLTGGGTWKNLPDRLSTDIDIEGVFEKIKSELDDPKIVISNDIERYLCCYIYWVSLAEGYIRNEDRRVEFLHTPIEHESSDIERGVNLASAIIRAMTEDIENKG